MLFIHNSEKLCILVVGVKAHIVPFVASNVSDEENDTLNIRSVMIETECNNVQLEKHFAEKIGIVGHEDDMVQKRSYVR